MFFNHYANGNNRDYRACCDHGVRQSRRLWMSIGLAPMICRVLVAGERADALVAPVKALAQRCQQSSSQGAGTVFSILLPIRALDQPAIGSDDLLLMV